MSTTTPAAHRGRRRFLPLVWAASAFAAVVLVLGVNGTLSAWTSAIITNDTNTVATANALILKEVGPDGTAAHTAQTCYSSTGASNTARAARSNQSPSASIAGHRAGGTADTPVHSASPMRVSVLARSAIPA